MELRLFEYTDYRQYLKDYYQFQKNRRKSFSFRSFAQKAKLGSPNYLKLVIDGERRITDQNLPQFIRGLQLGRSEADYFSHLVLYQESKDSDAKQLHLQEMLKIRMRNLKNAEQIEASRLDFLKHWYHAAVRELVLLQGFKADPVWISQRLGSKITPRQAQESLEVLKTLEFIKLEDGQYKVNDPLITTTDEISSHLIRQIHKQFMELGIEAIFNEPVDRREVNSLTVAVPRSKVSEVKSAIKEFRKELNKRFSSDQGNEEVYHLVINFFPLTAEKSTKGVEA